MDAPQSVRILFATLGKRLFYYESDSYQIDNSSDEIWGIDCRNFDYEDCIKTLGNGVNNFEPSEVYQISDEYIDRIGLVLENLKYKEFEYRDSSNGIIKKPLVKKRQVEIKEEAETELYSYLHFLFSILDTRKAIAIKKSTNEDSLNPKIVIQLPTDFTISQINQHFKQPLSRYTITLFLFYLRDIGIIPPYEQGELSKLAPAFFARHEKTIATDLRNIDTNLKSKKDLTELRETIERLLTRIDEDLKKAKR